MLMYVLAQIADEYSHADDLLSEWSMSLKDLLKAIRNLRRTQFALEDV